MTAEKEPVDLHNVEPVVHGRDPEEEDRRAELDRAGIADASPVDRAALVGPLAETDDPPPPDPDDLDRLRR
jgi:hypothetical protein